MAYTSPDSAMYKPSVSGLIRRGGSIPEQSSGQRPQSLLNRFAIYGAASALLHKLTRVQKNSGQRKKTPLFGSLAVISKKIIR